MARNASKVGSEEIEAFAQGFDPETLARYNECVESIHKALNVAGADAGALALCFVSASTDEALKRQK